MSLVVYIAHTGLRLETDPGTLSSIEQLKAWVTEQSGIEQAHQIVLTQRGKLVKNLNTLSDEIFIYDRVLFSFQEGQPRASSPEIRVPKTYIPAEAPTSLSDQSSLQAWQSLFKQRREWASSLADETERLLDDVHHFDSQAGVIQRATAIAAIRLKQNTGGLQEKYIKAKSWVEETLQEPKSVTSDFKNAVGRLNMVQADGELLRFLQPPGASSVIPPKAGQVSLRSLIDLDTAKVAATRANDAIKWLERQTKELGTKYEDLLQDCNYLVDECEKDFADLDGGDVQRMANDLAEEVHAIVAKITSDCDTAVNSPDMPRYISSLSRLAHNHTSNLLPSLAVTAKDISELLQKTVQRRNTSQTIALQNMQKISLTELRFADIQKNISELGIEEDEDRMAFEIMSFIAGLPAIYASVLCEIVRRKEWTEKMMTDSSTIAEEMATHKDDEERRRTKWSKSIQEFLKSDILDSRALDVDVNLKNQSSSWPKLTRKDINNYANHLRGIGGFESVLTEITEQVKSLDAPSKQQVRRTNAFRNGSIHDATYGRQSLLLRGDDDLIGALQSDKSRLEERLKGSESRIRKLEDLLHRQSQARLPGSSPRNSLDRPPTSPIIHPPGVASPKGGPENFSRRSSMSSRRVSGNWGGEEKALAQRIVQLEAELVSERTRSAQNQDNVKAQEDLKLQVKEAASMKKDLMENFNAQQTEFDGERRLLTDENKKLKMKLEELEEEIDRLIGSNDNARLGLDERMQAHEDEITTIRKESLEEIQRLQGQLDMVRNDCESQREKAYALEQQQQTTDAERKTAISRAAELDQKLSARDAEMGERHKSLQAIFAELSEDGKPPGDFDALLAEAEGLSRKASSHLNDMRVALGSVRAENGSYRDTIATQEEQLASLREEHTEVTSNADTLQEKLGSEQARFATLQQERQDERKELESLRTKLADGESGPEALKNRLSTEEQKVTDISMKLAAIRSEKEQLEKNLDHRNSELDTARNAKLDYDHSLLERAKRAEQISVLLFSQTDRLTHLLEHIGYQVMRQDDSMIIQRVSRSSNPANSIANVEQSHAMGRSLSGPVPKAANNPPEYIHWALSSNEDQEESQFNVFLQESQAFDMDAFGEAVIKRIKDTEHIARKWQREAKSYREKYHRTQYEAQTKIAFRSFREGDLALFLPTRNTAPNQRSWAAFNVGAPHYFLREQDSHRLSSRDWLLARISKVEERVVDLSRSETSLKPLPSSSSLEEDNPFGLSDGLRWYFLDAAEEKLGAPTTPGLGKTTVASAHVDAAGSIQRKKEVDESSVTRTLAKSLDSRRSSGNSRKSLIGATANPVTTAAAAAHVEGLAAGAASSSLRTAESAPQDNNNNTQAVRGRNAIPEEGSDGTAAAEMSPRRQDTVGMSPRRDREASVQGRGERSPVKGKAWDSLWSLDLNLEGRKKKRGE